MTQERKALVERALNLCEAMITNDPTEPVSDAGHTLLDLWKHEIAEIRRAALSAPTGVKVKKLEWSTDEDRWWSAQPDSMFRGYEVRVTDAGKTRMRRGAEDWQDFAGSADEAKAIWQADFDRRILSALSTMPGEVVAWQYRWTEDEPWQDSKIEPVVAPFKRPLYAAPAQHDGWRLIETAPKDGRRIDVWQPGRKSGSRICDVFWSASEEWWCIEGDEPSDHLPLAIIPEPTHWLPLPTSPLKGGEGNG